MASVEGSTVESNEEDWGASSLLGSTATWSACVVVEGSRGWCSGVKVLVSESSSESSSESTLYVHYRDKAIKTR